MPSFPENPGMTKIGGISRTSFVHNEGSSSNSTDGCSTSYLNDCGEGGSNSNNSEMSHNIIVRHYFL